MDTNDRIPLKLEHSPIRDIVDRPAKDSETKPKLEEAKDVMSEEQLKGLGGRLVSQSVGKVTNWEKLKAIGQRFLDQTVEDAAASKRVELPNILGLLTGTWWKIAVALVMLALLALAVYKLVY